MKKSEKVQIKKLDEIKEKESRMVFLEVPEKHFHALLESERRKTLADVEKLIDERLEEIVEDDKKRNIVGLSEYSKIKFGELKDLKKAIKEKMK